MKNLIKKIIDILFGAKYINHLNLMYNYYMDYKLYYQYSNIFKRDSYNKIESLIILDYHSLEKGFLFKEIKPKFGRDKVVSLINNINSKIILDNVSNSQIQVALNVLCKYYSFHSENNINIEDYYPEREYLYHLSLLSQNYDTNFSPVINFNRDVFYSNSLNDFKHFSNSRKSVRAFTGKKIEQNVIKNAISLALNSPSVCNRQASKVYLIEDKEKIDGILKVQSGFNGFIDNVVQLLVVTTDRSAFYTVGERSQLFIDGGIFLMNLLYCLHFYEIGNCPANWGKSNQEEARISNFFKISKSEKIICLIPIGQVKKEFSVCLSKRRDLDEVFFTA